jgi:hypothetical protein
MRLGAAEQVETARRGEVLRHDAIRGAVCGHIDELIAHRTRWHGVLRVGIVDARVVATLTMGQAVHRMAVRARKRQEVLLMASVQCTSRSYSSELHVDDEGGGRRGEE